MKLKKLIASVLSAAMLSTMAVMPVRAETSTWWELDNTALTSYSNASNGSLVAMTKAGGGKAADDYVLKYTNAPYIRLNTTTNMSEDKMLKAPMTDMTQYKGYMIVSMNVMSPVDSQKLTVTTNQGNIIMGTNAGGKIPVNSEYGFTADRWNSVVCLIRLDNGSTESLQTTYVNGKQISQRKHNLFSSGKTEVRLNADGSGDMYIDDVKVQFTTQEPDMNELVKLPVLSGVEGKATVNGNALEITQSITAGELSGNVKVFTDSTFTTTLSANDTVDATNVITLTDDYGRINYYTVKKSGEWTLDNNAVNTTNPITAVTNVGGGKAADDDVLKYTGSSFIRLNTNYNLSEDKMLKTPLSDMTQYKGYMIVSMNVMSPADTQRISVTTNGGNIIMGNKYGGAVYVNSENGFTANRWNNVVCLIRLDNGSTTSLQTTYVNGTQISERAHNLFASGKTDVRLNADGSGDIYFDDVKVQFTTEAPDINAIVKMPSVNEIEGKSTLKGNAYDLTGEVAVGELSADNAVVKVFSSSAFKEVLTADTKLKAGNVIVVTEGNFGKMSYYTVTADSLIPEDTEWTLDNKAVSTTSSITAVTNAGGGKTADDDVLKYTDVAFIRLNTSYNLSEEKMLKTPLEDMTNYTGYMIVSMNVMSPVETQKITVTTNSGNIIMGTDAGGKISVNSENNFATNRWNNVVCLIRLDNGSTTSLQTTYVNGKQISQRAHNLFSSGKTDVRLNADGSGVVYFDDVKVQFTTEAPDIDAITAMPSIDDIESKASKTDAGFEILTKVAVGELSAGNASIKVYDSLTLDYLLEESSQLYQGNVIVLTDDNNKMSYYTVIEKLSDKAGITVYANTVTANAYLDKGMLILALYDNDGVLKQVKISEEKGETKISLKGEFETAKAFVFDRSYTPLCEAAVYKKGVTVACWGDSLTYGQGSSNVNEKSYPAILKQLTGYNVYNTAVGGETAMTIAAKQGGVNILLDEDVVIPADDTEVEIKFSAYNDDGTYAGVVTPRATNIGNWNPCEINGIKGTLTVEVDSSVWPRVLKWAKFKRDESGEETVVAKGTAVKTEALDIAQAADINIIYIGENGGWNSDNTTKNDNDAQDLVVLIEKMLSKTKNPEKYIVIGLQNGSQPQTDAALSEAFGEHLILPKTYLATKTVLTDSGITPTANDLTAIENGKIPPSILSTDGVHMNDAGYAALAKMVFNKMQELGYYSEPVRLVSKHSDANDLTQMSISRAKSKIEYGVGGKSQTDAVGKLEASGTDDGSKSFFVSETLSSDVTNRKVTATLSVYMNNSISSIVFATNGHSSLTDHVYDRHLNEGEWNTISMVYDPVTQSSDLYVNDVYLSTHSKKMGDSFRVVFYVSAADFYDGYIYYDDLNIYSGEIPHPAADFSAYNRDGIYISGYGNGTTVKEFVENITFLKDNCRLLVCDDNGNILEDNDIVKKGYELILFCEDAPIGHYYLGIAEMELTDTYVMTNGYKNQSKKFADGEVEVSANIASEIDGKAVKATAELYNADDTLVSANSVEMPIEGESIVSVDLDVNDYENKYIRFRVEDASTNELIGEETFYAYSGEIIEDVAPLYKGFTTKSAVFNYDDCRAEDIRLIELLEKYGAKGTFNLTSSYIYRNLKAACAEATGKSDEASVYEFAKEVYAGHELSTHTVNHYPAGLNPGEESADSNGIKLVGRSTEEEVADIQGCPVFLREKLDAQNVIGLAWPNGYGSARNDYESHLLPAMKEIGIKYARATANGSFDLPTDWYEWNATCHHNNAPYYADKYVSLRNEGSLKCFFNWGHSYEFDTEDESKNWTMIENVISKLANDNIWFATNGDVYRYSEAVSKAVVSDEQIINNSDITLYYQVNGENIEIASGETYSLN